MESPTGAEGVEARERFRRYAFRAEITDLLALVSGHSSDLVQFDEVAKQLKARQAIQRGTQDVALDDIVGSVGRYRDFTRTFLPRGSVNQERWTSIDAALNSQKGLPPIELFKVGGVYFVRDGNHRVSVARANGLPSIEAYVTEIKTAVPLTIDDFERDRWIIKAEYAEFLSKTNLDKLRPEQDIRFTEPGRYAMLLNHIAVHQYLQNQQAAKEDDAHIMTWEEAVVSWYDNVYCPIVSMIHKYNLLEHFPRRTEADLYGWIVMHREALAEEYGLAPLSPEAAVSTFAQAYSERPLEHVVQELRLGLRRVFGQNRIPLGMSEEEFRKSRARHDAGELTLLEAERKRGKRDCTDAESDVAS